MCMLYFYQNIKHNIVSENRTSISQKVQQYETGNLNILNFLRQMYHSFPKKHQTLPLHVKFRR